VLARQPIEKKKKKKKTKNGAMGQRRQAAAGRRGRAMAGRRCADDAGLWHGLESLVTAEKGEVEADLPQKTEIVQTGCAKAISAICTETR